MNAAPCLAPGMRTRLLGILGRLGSEFDGERAAAGLLASRLLRNEGLSWDQVIGALQLRPPVITPPVSRNPFITVRDLLARLDELTAWEREFLASITHRRALTAKQIAVLDRIKAKLQTQAGAR